MIFHALTVSSISSATRLHREGDSLLTVSSYYLVVPFVSGFANVLTMEVSKPGVQRGGLIVVFTNS